MMKILAVYSNFEFKSLNINDTRSQREADFRADGYIVRRFESQRSALAQLVDNYQGLD
uniref:Uncharacterized protein n=1 Tax=Tetranychus urticae TaxID=32264 RepID=T1JX31_TETUR